MIVFSSKPGFPPSKSVMYANIKKLGSQRTVFCPFAVQKEESLAVEKFLVIRPDMLPLVINTDVKYSGVSTKH